MADGDPERRRAPPRGARALARSDARRPALESHGRDEIAQLDELRLTALMDRIDCDLALGRHEHVLGELQVLVREHPLRERLRAQQMLALYRADRQAEALAAYPRPRGARRRPRDRAERSAATTPASDPAPRPGARDAGGTAAANGGAPAEAAPPATPAVRPTSRGHGDSLGGAGSSRLLPRDPCGLGDGRRSLGLGRRDPRTSSRTASSGSILAAASRRWCCRGSSLGRSHLRRPRSGP